MTVAIGQSQRTGRDNEMSIPNIEGLREPSNFRPVKIAEVELTDGLGQLYRQLEDSVEYRTVVALVRLHSQPLGLVAFDVEVDDPELDWPCAVTEVLGADLESHLVGDEIPGRSLVDGQELWNGWVDELPTCLSARRTALVAGPMVTVVVATRERPELLRRCLDSLLRVQYPEFEVVVVDNDPESDQGRTVVAGFEDAARRVRYVREDRRGLAAAHNRGLEVAEGEIVAFTDDDVLVDRHWLAELVTPFVPTGNVAGATGLILPAELETRAQLLLESHGRYGKGYQARLFDLDRNRPDDRLFPFTAGTLGSGANMAFETEFLRSVGGFDAALGAGTIARGGDDLAALFRVMTSGRALAYRPGAIVWHHHRRDMGSVRKQAFNYALGLGAFLTSAVVNDPKAAVGLLRRLPAGLSLMRNREMDRRETNWPASMESLEHRGLLVGPLAYAASRARKAVGPGMRPRTAING